MILPLERDTRLPVGTSINPEEPSEAASEAAFALGAHGGHDSALACRARESDFERAGSWPALSSTNWELERETGRRANPQRTPHLKAGDFPWNARLTPR